MKALIIIKHKETELFAAGMIAAGFEVQKLYITGQLPDMDSVTFDEININTEVVIIDSFEGSCIAQHGYVNNAIFMLLRLDKRLEDEEYALLCSMDFHRIEVKDYEDKKADDWKEASVLLKKQLSKSISCGSSL